MAFIRFSLDNPLLVNLSLFFVLLLGVIYWQALPREIFPIVDLDMVHIATDFEGASPLEVEQQITLSIEEQFQDVRDIDFISSSSVEGRSNIYIKLRPGSDADDFIRVAESTLNAMDTLPDNAEVPELRRLRTRFPVITFTLYGDVSDAELYYHADRVRHRLQQLPGVANVSRTGVRDWEIWVQVDAAALAARKVSLRELETALRRNLQALPGGSIQAQEGDVRLRSRGVMPEPQYINEIVLRSDADGGKLQVQDVAEVESRFETAANYARFNGQPSVNLTVTKVHSASTIAVADAVKTLADTLRDSLPGSIQADYHTDVSEYVKIRINTVKSSGLVGLVLVLISLCVLLNFRVALITAFGIPVSFLFAVILIYHLGHTLNMVSMFAFLIVLGMIVDDAIIVTENIYRHIESGMPRRAAAERGAREVLAPVMVSTLTTIAAFLPMFAIGGIMGHFLVVVPVVVSFALVGSLVEAFAILPAHSMQFLRPRRTRLINWGRALAGYEGVLRRCIANRWPTCIASVCLLFLCLLFAQTRLPFQLFDDVDTGEFFLNIETANTYSLEDSLALAKRLEQRLFATIDEQELRSIITNVGVSIIDFNRNKRASNVIQYIIDLQKPVPQGFIEKWVTPLISLGFDNFGPRVRTTEAIMDDIRAALADEPAIQRLSILKPEAGPAGDDIEIGILGEDLARLRTEAEELAGFLAGLEGVSDVVHDQETGKLEYEYTLNESGRRLGLSQEDIASVVRSGYVGQKVVYVTRGADRIPVRLFYQESLRQRSDSLHQLPIVLASGEQVYVGDVADIRVVTGANTIRRRDRQRMAKVTANVDDTIITSSEVLDRVTGHFAEQQGSARLLFLGEKKNAEESFKGMKNALFIVLGLIFFMLTALFRTLREPLLVMFAIPFGLIGVVVGHVLFGYNMQFLSAIGMLALAGIIVNDSLILVEFIKRLRGQGVTREEAVVQACKVRARPILLTTITTFLGLSPLIFFSTGQTAFMAPMAISLGFGLLFATVLILLTLPCFYLIVDALPGGGAPARDATRDSRHPAPA